MYIKDPFEILEGRVERLMDEFVDEFTCMECGKRYDYEMICVDPMGYGPVICEECFKMGKKIKTEELKKGMWVKYVPFLGGVSEIGRVKSWNDKFVFVVYKCDEKWDQYENYTGAATKIEDLVHCKK